MRGHVRCRKKVGLCSLSRVLHGELQGPGKMENFFPDVVMKYNLKAGIVITF